MKFRQKCNSYTEDKVVLNFHGKRFFCLTQGGVRQDTRPVTCERNTKSRTLQIVIIFKIRLSYHNKYNNSKENVCF
jgi:hypothetical protein